ncbi:MAG: alkaline phosphatase family protein [Candidatus Methanomethylicaceae archaeon]
MRRAARFLAVFSVFYLLSSPVYPVRSGHVKSGADELVGKSSGPQPRRVVIIDIDGLSRGAFSIPAVANKLPNFARIIGQYEHGPRKFQHAMYFKNATTVFPSVTLTGHASIFTGVYPGAHGIVGNEWFDRQSEDFINYMSLEGQMQIFGFFSDPQGLANHHLKATTLYTAARQAGKRSLVGFNQYWKGAKNVRPDLELLQFAFGERLVRADIDGIIESFKKYDQGMVTEIIKQLDSLRRNGEPLPDIITLYFAGLDAVGHLISTSRTSMYLQDVIDPLIGKFLDKLKELDPGWFQHTLFFITADHGRSDVPSESSKVGGKLKDMVEKALEKAGYDPGIETLGQRDVQIALNGGMAHIYIRKRGNRILKGLLNVDVPWQEKPRLKEDVLPAARALVSHKELREYIASVFVRKDGPGSGYKLFWQHPSLPKQELEEQIQKQELIQKLDCDRSGDILLLLKSQFYFRKSCGPVTLGGFCSVEDLASAAGVGSSHGSIWDSDLAVPLVVGGGNVVPGVSEEPVSTVNIAQTVAWYLGFTLPNAEPRLPITLRDDLPPVVSDLPTLLLIDTSGSMADNNKIEQARQAALDALDEIRKNMRRGMSPPPVAILTFSGSCSPASTRKLLDFTTDLDRVESVLRWQLPRPSGETPSPQAVEVALNEMSAFLERQSRPTDGRIILLSDGQSTCGNVRPPGTYSRRIDIPVRRSGQPLIGSQALSRVRFLTIGFDVLPGSEAERDLQYLASISGGKYFNAPDRRQLARTFQKFVRVFVPKTLGRVVTVDRNMYADFERGRQAMLQRDYQSALEAFRSFVSAEPDNPAGLFNLAQALEATDHYKGAAEYYSRYLEIAPNAPDRAEVERLVQQLRQDYVDQFTYYLGILRSDLAYLMRYYQSLFHRRNEELAREFGGFVNEKVKFYEELPDILEINERWLEIKARDLSDSLNTLAERVGLPTFDFDAISLLTIPIRQLEELIGRIEQYGARYVR